MLRAVVSRLMVALGVLVALLTLAILLGQPWAGKAISAGTGVPRVAVVAHRGASGHAPEETLPAYRLAAALGADYLELDLQRSADGVLLAFHDDTVARTTDAATRFPGREGQSVAAFTWAELSSLDAGSWFNAAHPERARDAWRGARIARLDEIIAVADQGGAGRRGRGPGLYIETKEPQLFPGIEAELVSALREAGWLGGSAEDRGRVIFQSFSLDSLRELRRLAPNVPRVLLVKADMLAERPFEAWMADASELAAGMGPVGTAVYPWRVGAAHRAGLLVHPYTINKAWQMGLARLLSVDGMFTDEPGMLLGQLGRPSADDEATLLGRLGY